jgi:hypothetical protein
MLYLIFIISLLYVSFINKGEDNLFFGKKKKKVTQDMSSFILQKIYAAIKLELLTLVDHSREPTQLRI